MAKTNVRYFSKLLDQMRKAVRELPEKTYLEIGEYTSKRIVATARSGSTMISGTKEKLKSLSPGYVRARQIQQLKGDFSLDQEFFSPKKSNLTRTGQFLSSIRVTDIQKDKNRLVISPTGAREESSLTNEKLAAHLARGGRNIFGLDETGRKVIQQKVIRALQAQIRKNLLRK